MSQSKEPVRVGLEVFAAAPERWVPPGARVGLLLNPASVDLSFRSARDVIHGWAGPRLTALFSPQHGVHSEVQDNMVESPHGIDRRLGVPIWSLYADRRKPSREMLSGIDVLLVDLQDVGTRVYTFVWTLRLLMEACGQSGTRVLVLDRPNPIGGLVAEGNRLRPQWSSFVGLEPVPMRHGLTIGELALWFRGCRGVPCDLQVVPLDGWSREMLWPDTGRPWVSPSPNMPSADTALLYPGTVLLEGTNASEGRGTTRPFELVGGPWVDGERLAARMRGLGLPGAAFRPVAFQPTFQKWAGKSCGGVQIHVTDAGSFRPYRTGLGLLCALWELYRDEGFDWRPPPYEYETERMPIDLLLGDEQLRRGIEGGIDPLELESRWLEEIDGWWDEASPYLLY